MTNGNRNIFLIAVAFVSNHLIELINVKRFPKAIDCFPTIDKKWLKENHGKWQIRID
jgi:hypothetical protein